MPSIPKMLREDLVRKKLKLLKPFIGEKAENIWLSYCASNPMDWRSWEVKIDILAAKYVQTFEEYSILEAVPPEYCCGDILPRILGTYHLILFDTSWGIE